MAVVCRCMARARARAIASSAASATAESGKFGFGSGLSVLQGRRLGPRLVLVPVVRVAVGNMVSAGRMTSA